MGRYVVPIAPVLASFNDAWPPALSAGACRPSLGCSTRGNPLMGIVDAPVAFSSIRRLMARALPSLFGSISRVAGFKHASFHPDWDI